MKPKWYEFGEKSLAKDDEVKKNYTGRLNGEYGHLMLSGKKLLFVKEEGFLRKKYAVTLNLPYEDIEEVKQEDRYDLKITGESGGSYEFITDDIPVNLVDESVQEIIKHQ
jgi:hypothetical protein